ncbi:Nif3-like dinuclear metal center hexameric protein [bacterium]|nr:Nif3-like dinuclear metal center hexameric protein [bacterium]
MPTAREIVARIKQNVGCPWSEKTIDTFKAGDPDAPVTGVATTFMATMDVLRRAHAAGLNFVITHEPTFYNHMDETQSLAGDPVLTAKQTLIGKLGLVVWRFHDHWHRRRPDGITEGIVEALGWKGYQRKGQPQSFDIPQTTVGDLASRLAQKLESRVPRIVGDPAMVVSRVALVLGAAGSASQIGALQHDDVDVLVAGETREWETVEYVRDAVALGRKKALVLTGHAASEEAGMRFCAQWLESFVKDVPVGFIPAGDPFVPVS